MRLIDADNLIEKCENLYMRGHVLFHGVTTFTIENTPTIEPDDLPVVHQLKEELALMTQQRDMYKSALERITAHGDCNDCEDVKGCRFVPGIGEDTRYNCPLWRGPQKEK